MAKRKEGFGENRCVRSMEIQIRGQRGSRGEFPGGPGIRTLCSHCQGCGFNPWSGTYNPSSHEVRQEKKKKEANLKARLSLSFIYFWSYLAACGILVTQRGNLCRQQRKRGILTTGQPENSELWPIIQATGSSCGCWNQSG